MIEVRSSNKTEKCAWCGGEQGVAWWAICPVCAERLPSTTHGKPVLRRAGCLVCGERREVAVAAVCVKCAAALKHGEQHESERFTAADGPHFNPTGA